MAKTVTTWKGGASKGRFTIEFVNDNDDFIPLSKVKIKRDSEYSYGSTYNEHISLREKEFKSFVDCVNKAYENFMKDKYPQQKTKKKKGLFW